MFGRSGSGLVSAEPSFIIRKHKLELVRTVAVVNHAICRRFVTLHPLTYQLWPFPYSAVVFVTFKLQSTECRGTKKARSVA